MNAQSHAAPGVAAAKRAADVCGAVVGLVLTAPLVPLIMLAVKLDSKGPAVFKQVRVGRAGPERTELFRMYKFRTMRIDAEKHTGAVWAQKNDPRITRAGRFLRKTRLDEIPQLINVLKGDMSLIGPRPERPGICGRLDDGIPFYAERTYGLRPGVTGLAQVSQGYDETIEDVRSKVLYDHAYALALSSWRGWLMRDAEIVLRTAGVVFGMRGR
ncbi:MAG: sugar transferase [Rhodospirillales bacterium]